MISPGSSGVHFPSYDCNYLATIPRSEFNKIIADSVEKASVLAIGWYQMGDLTGLKTKAEFQKNMKGHTMELAVRR